MKQKIRKERGNYTLITNKLFDPKMSLQAWGLYCFMYSKVDSWSFTLASMAKQMKNGRSSITSAMNELKEFGFLEYTKNNDGTGEYFVRVEPKYENRTMEVNSQSPILPHSENPTFRKSDPINKTDLDSKTDLSNKTEKKEQIKNLPTSQKSIDFPVGSKKEGQRKVALKESGLPVDFSKWTLDEFKRSLVVANQSYINDGKVLDMKELEKFYDYYTEPDKKGRMKFAINKTWDSKRRIKTWMDRAEAWGKDSGEKQNGFLMVADMIDKSMIDNETLDNLI